jgi:hypothetical protein
MAPAIVHEVLRSPGAPLEAETQRGLQPLLGHDIASVRIHTDARAAASAQAVNALAYTVGRHIVFDEGRYAPRTATGYRLLTHELGHALQQGLRDQESGPIRVGRADSHLERDADAQADAISARRPALAFEPAPPGTLSRQAVPMPVRPPVPVRPPLRVLPGGRTGALGRPIPVPEGRVRYMPDPADNSLEAMFERAGIEADRNRAIAELERPRATLLPGGTGPDFVTIDGTDTAVGTYGTVRYNKRSFHVLDAIADRVLKAQTPKQIMGVMETFIPQHVPRELQRPGIVPLTSPHWEVVYPPDVDPGGMIRLNVFVNALRRRNAGAIPDLNTQPLPAALADMLRNEKVEPKHGPCDAREVKRAGGHPPHDDYATKVTGSPLDFLLRTPEGISCQTDGVDSTRRTWEVKTQHLYLTDDGITRQFLQGGPIYKRIINRLEEQRARCVFVTSRCGYRFAYAFHDKEVVDFMNRQWFGIPPVLYRPKA